VAGGAIKYFGQGFSPRGEKNRFVLPSDFRARVKEASAGDRILCLDKHHRMPCLVGFGLSRTETFDDLVREEMDLAKSAGESFDKDERNGQLWAFQPTNFDESGRFVLSEYLCDLGRVKDGLYFHGGGDFFTVWAPEELFGMGPGWDVAKAKCRALMADAGNGRRGRR